MRPIGNVFNCTPLDRSGYDLLHAGVVALSTVEANGIRVDMEYLENALEKLKRHSKKVTLKLKETKLWERWKRQFGHKTKLSSKEQLADLLFNHMGFKATAFTDTGKPKADEEHLSTVDIPFIRGYIKLSKINTLRNKLIGIQRETVDGYLHAVFNLSMAKTFRSSSDTPNFQNMPIRDPWMGEVIRSCFIPRPGHVIVEVDYSGIEVRVAACYHLDPTMIEYITDPTRDMHRDMSAQIYKLPEEDVGKMHRYCAKNQFVFPQFYGDFYLNNAKAMWGSIDKFNLTGPSGEPLTEYLKTKGIKSRGACEFKEKPKPGTFEHHMREVENDFWNNRFGVYGQWKKDWWKQYQRKGGFDTLTGFRIEGIMAKNDVINYPVQGSAFHCLLWSLIRLQKQCRKFKMGARIVGQIHDSIVADVPIEELGTFLPLVKRVMNEDVKSYATWLNVPLDVEAEVTPENGSWFDKKEVGFAEDGYSYKGDTFTDISELLENLKTKK